MTICYSVKVESAIRISDKCFKFRTFDGREALIPSSQVFGRDWHSKTDAYWISAWILSKKDIQYSTKKQARFSKNGKMMPEIDVTVHEPKKVEPVTSNHIPELER